MVSAYKPYQSSQRDNQYNNFNYESIVVKISEMLFNLFTDKYVNNDSFYFKVLTKKCFFLIKSYRYSKTELH